MAPQAALLAGGTRLHLQHGPIDLIIGVEGDRTTAFDAAQTRFANIMDELVAELPALRQPLTEKTPAPRGTIARHMDCATRPHTRFFVTRMAAVAGAVADTILRAMRDAAPLRRAYVNNGGDIALHLGPSQRFTLAMASTDGHDLGRISVSAGDSVGGIATSGWRGRSHSLGIADSVTVLAGNAAQADVAATLIANAVDLPKHPAVNRKPASELSPDSDLGQLPVTTGCGPLSDDDIEVALARGVARAEAMREAGHIVSAALFLQGQARTAGTCGVLPYQQRALKHA